MTAQTPPPRLIHHSDRGSQYACHAYQQLLAEHGLVAYSDLGYGSPVEYETKAAA